MADPTRYLPAGVPAPPPEVVAQLRASILQQLATPHPPEPAELAVLIIADEAGVDLSGVDARAVWAQPPAERAPVFAALERLLAEHL